MPDKTTTMENNNVDKMPGHISPMLCTLVREPVISGEYLYELKWDGYRIISIVNNGKVRMNSRSGLDYTSKYPPIAKALKALKHNLIIDGEAVVFDKNGKPDFDALQLYNGHDAPIRYCVFDLLWLDGQNLMQMPLEQRKQLLKALVDHNDTFYYSESYDDGEALFQTSLDHNLEGIVAKNKHSSYQPGARNNAWLKIPTRKRQEFIIGGWAESDKSRSFRSLLFGAYDNGKLIWIGRSGGGYKQNEMPGILEKLQKLETKKSPFGNKVLDTKGARVHYVKPELVANFEFATWTKSRRIRKPATFLGFRLDKKPEDVVLELPKEAEVVEKEIEKEQDQPDNIEKTSGTVEGEEAGEAKSGRLENYRKKRQFDQTPEPTGGKANQDKLIFVVQKHDASHLHYDFRLEVRGVLKSWAVPKGPSMTPADHRLAMAVEDHPYDYKDFEGIIPEGQYGGGTVIIWDHGTYEPAEPVKGKKEQEHWLLSRYYKGSLSIILKGKKLKGGFNLSQIKGNENNSWLLTKVKDGRELKTDITKKDKSVVSGLSIGQMKNSAEARIWNSNREQKIDSRHQELQETASQKKHKTLAELYPIYKRKSIAGSNWKRIFEEKISSEGEIEIEGEILQLTNIEKKLWKKVNKAALIAYYNSISAYILPHLKGRPLSLDIRSQSAHAPGFYIKDMEGMGPAYLDVFSTKRKHKKAGKSDTINYAVCNNLASLLYLVNLGCIDLNPWNSRISNPLEPDYIVIDLDPSDNDFKKVIQTALVAKEYFDKLKLKSFVKTSGKTGMHIFIPCEGFSFSQTRVLAEHICRTIHKQLPDITTIEISTAQRGDKLFVDFSQNDEADTLASAYSVRPSKKPAVSAPLQWEEVKEPLSPDQFTISNMAKRLAKKGDLWADILDKRIKMKNSKILSDLLPQ